MESQFLRKWFFINLLLLIACCQLEAQSEVRFSQYQFTQGLINPAYNAVQPDAKANIITRIQWTTIEGAPITTALNLIFPTKNNGGYGFNVISDNIGITKNTEVSLSYAYKIALGKNIGFQGFKRYLSFGLTAGLMHRYFDFSQLQLNDPNDPIFNLDARELRPKLGFGLLYHSPKLLLGISSPSLAQTSVTDNVNGSLPINQINWNFQVQVYHEFQKYLGFKPSLLLKLVEGSKVELDVNVSVLFNKSLWVGTGYRSNRTLLFYFEVFVKPAFSFSYSFDYFSFAPNDIRNANAHEFRLSINLSQLTSKRWLPKRFLPF